MPSSWQAADDTDGDLASVGDQDLREHRICLRGWPGSVPERSSPEGVSQTSVGSPRPARRTPMRSPWPATARPRGSSWWPTTRPPDGAAGTASGRRRRAPACCVDPAPPARDRRRHRHHGGRGGRRRGDRGRRRRRGPGLKWPNDLVWPGDGSAPDRKLAGILAEAEWPPGADVASGPRHARPRRAGRGGGRHRHQRELARRPARAPRRHRGRAQPRDRRGRRP